MQTSVFLLLFHDVSKLVFFTSDLDFDVKILVFKIRKYEHVAEFWENYVKQSLIEHLVLFELFFSIWVENETFFMNNTMLILADL